MNEFDRASWLVRWPYGQRYVCYRMPETDRVKIWRFADGVAVSGPSLSTALEIATKIRNREMQ